MKALLMSLSHPSAPNEPNEKERKPIGFLVCLDELSQEETKELEATMLVVDITKGVVLSTGKVLDYVAFIIHKTAEC